MIETTEINQRDFLNLKTKEIRKELGQYFTSKPVAEYMAKMIRPVSAPTVRILDAGAGAGILTITAAQQCLQQNNKIVHAVLYEIDKSVITHLEENMKQLSKHFSKHSGKFTFEIRNEDFILNRPDKVYKESYDIASINPPYFKYNSKTSPYANATADLFKGNPNIYASFMAIVANTLSKDGQMVAIVPRSFTNGLYFKGFRNFISTTMNLNKIHVFRSRNQVFKQLSVLQENVICYYTKCTKSSKIEICTSNGYEDLNHSVHNKYPKKLIIDSSNSQNIIRIPETKEEAQILEMVENWPTTFSESNYFISTGPVVEHRTREYITSPDSTKQSTPLLRMHNVKKFRTEWTGKNKKDARFLLCDDFKKHVSINQIYIILKRFSSKDEKRRLTAGIHVPDSSNHQWIGLENHLNYIGKDKGQLELLEAYGLASLFNSTFMDKYFRAISGNTQVNATEIRLMKLPSRKTILDIGKKALKNKNDLSQDQIDKIIKSLLNIDLEI